MTTSSLHVVLQKLCIRKDPLPSDREWIVKEGSIKKGGIIIGLRSMKQVNRCQITETLMPGLREPFKSFKLFGDMIKCVLQKHLYGSHVETEVSKIYTVAYFVLKGSFTFNCVYTLLTIFKPQNVQTQKPCITCLYLGLLLIHHTPML